MTSYHALPHVGFKKLAEVTVVVSLKGGAYYTLQGSSKFIWDLLTNGMSQQQIAQSLSEQYQIPIATAVHDTARFIEDLIVDNLIKPQ